MDILTFEIKICSQNCVPKGLFPQIQSQFTANMYISSFVIVWHDRPCIKSYIEKTRIPISTSFIFHDFTKIIYCGK